MKKLLLFFSVNILLAQFSFGQGTFSVSFGTDATACNGSLLTFTAVVTGGTGPFGYQWESTGDAVSCDTCRTITTTINQNSTFIVIVTDSSDSNTASDTVHITLNVPGTITSSGRDTFCSGNPVVLQTSAVSNGYVWLLNGNPIPGATGSSYSVDSSGIYQLTYGQEGSCPDTTNAIRVLVYPSPSAAILPSGPLSICQHDSVTFQAAQGPNVTYFWILDGRELYDSTNAYTTSVAGNYQLLVTSLQGCTDSSNLVALTVRPLPIVGYQPFSDFTVCTSGTPVTLIGGTPSGGVYSGSAVTSDSIFNPSSANLGLNVVTYTFTGDDGCNNSAFENITLEVCTGINELQDKNFLSIYPNPAADYVILSVSEQAMGGTVYVRDITGREFFGSRISGGDFRLETSGLANGIYLVSLVVNGQEITRKLTVAR
jgi:hypothetical protein